MTPRDVARSYWDVEAKRDLDAVMDHYHEDAVFWAGPATFSGHAEIRSFYEQSAAEYPEIESVRITHDVTNGNEAALEWEAVMVDPSGGRHPLRGTNIVRVEDGRFREVHSYYDPASLTETL